MMLKGEMDRATALALLGGNGENLPEPTSKVPKRSYSEAGLDEENKLDKSNSETPVGEIDDGAAELDDLLMKAKRAKMEPLLNLGNKTFFFLNQAT